VCRSRYTVDCRRWTYKHTHTHTHTHTQDTDTDTQSNRIIYDEHTYMMEHMHVCVFALARVLAHAYDAYICI
jgi:hypothetical protein